MIEAYIAFFTAFHIAWMTPIIIIAIIISISGVAAWIIGPSRGLMVASQDTALPKILSKVTRKVVGGLGLFACLAVFVLGFIPPSQIETGNPLVFESLLIGGIIIFIAPVYFLIRKK